MLGPASGVKGAALQAARYGAHGRRVVIMAASSAGRGKIGQNATAIGTRAEAAKRTVYRGFVMARAGMVRPFRIRAI